MAILKCKMCGGDVEVAADKTFGTCEYCGSTMTFPKVDDEQRAAAFNRGNHFRRIGEFDKALAVYERIVQEDDTDAEAHWCCALCRFGIEYVEDPATMEWMPTCHRASFDSFMEDVDYLAAVKHSVGITQRQYQKDAAKIAEVQRGILATSQNAEPYDVFICYKETDENGNRTKDSLLAQEIYYQLTEQGRRVFFSRITLEDVAGTQYEPYIFAALHSARVMIVVGTKPEYLNSVWVKNEWSRFLSLMKQNHNKLLLPCYREMDPYDLPEQLSVLQSYDMAKIGFIQDLIRGVAKVLDVRQVKPVVQTVVAEPVATGGGQVAPLLKRAFMFLEDGDYEKADDFCEQVLNLDPECAEAYLGKLMAELRIRTRQGLKECVLPFDRYNNYQKAIRFGNAEQKKEWKGYITYIQERNMKRSYDVAVQALQAAHTQADCEKAARMFMAMGDYQDSAAMVAKALEKGKALEYAEAERYANSSNLTTLRRAVTRFRKLQGYRDAEERAVLCEKRILKIQAVQAQDAHKRRVRKTLVIGSIIILLVLAILLFAVWLPNARAKARMERLAPYRADIAPYQHMLAVGDGVIAGVNAAGTLRVAYLDTTLDQESINTALDVWTNMKMVTFGAEHVVGLRADGSVIAAGSNASSQCAVSNWTDVVEVDAGKFHTVGLLDSGDVVATGWNQNGESDVWAWENITAIAAGDYHTVGLTVDGTVCAVGGNASGQCAVNKWKNIVAVAAGSNHTVGLKADGRVVAVGENWNDQCEVEDWTDIIAIAAGDTFTVGLRADGTLEFTGSASEYTFEYSSDWQDIVAIEAGPDCVLAMTEDGRVLCSDNEYEYLVYTWDLLPSVDITDVIYDEE